MLTNNNMTCLVSRWACVLGLLALPIVGCSDPGSDGGAGGTGATGGTGGAGGTGGTPLPDTLRVLFTTSEYNADSVGSVGPPLEGVEVCVEYADTESCTTSNEDGKGELDFPTNQEFTWTLEKEGYGPALFGGLITEGSEAYYAAPFSWLMTTDAQLEAIAMQLGTTYPWEGGIVGLVQLPPHAGVTFDPVGSSIDAVGEAFYLDAATGEYSLTLEATTGFANATDRHPLGHGGFTEVTPGVQQFEFGGAVGDCHEPNYGWPGDTANRIRVPVREGFRTIGIMNCDAP